MDITEQKNIFWNFVHKNGNFRPSPSDGHFVGVTYCFGGFRTKGRFCKTQKGNFARPKRVSFKSLDVAGSACFGFAIAILEMPPWDNEEHILSPHWHVVSPCCAARLLCPCLLRPMGPEFLFVSAIPRLDLPRTNMCEDAVAYRELGLHRKRKKWQPVK